MREPRKRYELSHGHAGGGARPHQPADIFEIGVVRERLRAMPPVDGEGQGPPHPHVVEWRAARVEDDRQVADPRTLSDLEAVCGHLHHLVALARSEAAELGHDPPALHGFHRLFFGSKFGPIAVKIRLTRQEIFVPALARPMVRFYVLDKDERPGSE